MTLPNFQQEHKSPSRELRRRTETAKGALLGLAAACSLLLSACDRVELLGTFQRDDAGVSGASGASGADGAGEPAEPRLVETISDPGARDTDPSFTEDLRELYFMSDRAGSKDIWRSERPDRTSAWGAPELVSELNTAGEEENPCISNDGRDIWFFTDRDRTLGAQWHASRAARGELWSAPEPVSELTTGAGSSDVSVAVDPTRTLFILNSKRSGNLPYQLYQIERDGPDGPFSEPSLLAEVVSSTDDFDPDLRRGGRFLIFDSRRTGIGQIFFSVRAQSDQPFPAAAPVEALRSEYQDGAPALSEDLDYVMFSSTRSGNGEIYEAALVPPL